MKCNTKTLDCSFQLFSLTIKLIAINQFQINCSSLNSKTNNFGKKTITQKILSLSTHCVHNCQYIVLLSAATHGVQYTRVKHLLLGSICQNKKKWHKLRSHVVWITNYEEKKQIDVRHTINSIHNSYKNSGIKKIKNHCGYPVGNKNKQNRKFLNNYWKEKHRNVTGFQSIFRVY